MPVDYPFQERLKRSKHRLALRNEAIVFGRVLLSIQCHSSAYCTPRRDLEDPTAYEEYEVAIFIDEVEFENAIDGAAWEAFFFADLVRYIDGRSLPYVPAELVEHIFDVVQRQAEAIASDYDGRRRAA